MARLTNRRTGVVVNVDDLTAATLRAGSDTWDGDEPEQKKVPAKKATSRRSSK